MTSARGGSNLLSNFWTPIVAVGSTGPGGPNAQISVSTFGASVVPDRPRLLVVLYKGNHTHDLVLASGSFTLSLLSAAQTHLVPKLGFYSGLGANKLEGLDYTLTDQGNPVFAGSVGWLECSLIEPFDLGDATALLSAVDHNVRLTNEEPLVWSKLAPALPPSLRDEWDLKMARDIVHYRSLMKWGGD